MDPRTTPETPSEDASASFADILSEFERQQRAPGPAQEAIKGTVVAVTAESVFVDIGRKTEGLLPADGLRDSQGTLSVARGDTVFVAVTGFDPTGYYTLSTVKVARPKDWSSLEKAFAEKRTIAGRVTEQVKGGLRVDVGVTAFMPASRSGVREVADLEKLVGQEIECRIIQLKVDEEDVVVDRRVVLEEAESKLREDFFQSLEEGAVVRGTVRSLTEFGAFVELSPGVDGLLHVSDMSWTRVAKPSDVVSPGENLEVKILKVNRDTRKVSLGLKQLMPEPWTLAAERFHTGDRVRGIVSRLTDFGAFVELMPGVDGLIHLSELSWSKKIRKPSDLLKVGESVEVAVLGVNLAERRISLGLKQTLGDPWEEAASRFPVGTIVEGVVGNLAKFGAFVEIAPGLDGMIHIADITREKRLNHPREALEPGRKVRAVVLELDPDKRRIRLGMKQLEPTSADEYIAEHRVGETVTGRLLEVHRDQAKVELGDGVTARCLLPAAAPPGGEADGSPSADVTALGALLASKWKGRGSGARSRPEAARAGQIRTFRILSLDPKQKHIEVELAG